MLNFVGLNKIPSPHYSFFFPYYLMHRICCPVRLLSIYFHSHVAIVTEYSIHSTIMPKP